MTLVPNYKAYIKRFIYQPVSGKTGFSITYNRQALYVEARNDYYSAYEKHTPPAYAITTQTRPVMAAPSLVDTSIAGYSNEGVSGPYTAIEEASVADMTWADGYWTIPRLMQKQIPLWQASIAYHKQFIEALEEPLVDDTWLTDAIHVEESTFVADRAIASYNKVTALGNLNNVFEVPEHNVGYDESGNEVYSPVIKARVTPCYQLYWLSAGNGPWVLNRHNENFLVDYSASAPLLEYTPLQAAATAWEIDPTAPITLVDSERLPVEGVKSSLYDDIQPVYWEKQHTASSRYALRQAATVAAAIEWVNLDPANRRYRTEPAPPTLDRGFVNTSIYIENGVYQISRSFPSYLSYLAPIREDTYAAVGEVYIREALVGGVWVEDSVRTTDATAQITHKPRPWDHTDSALTDYVPFHPSLWRYRMSSVLEYAKEPDARFDGLCFGFMVKKKHCLRSWYGFIKWERTGSLYYDYEFLPAILESTGLKNIATGEVVGGGTCYHMTPVEFDLSDYLTPDFMEVEWPGYDWKDVSITIPGGSFLLQKGSNAPLYPTFKGSYVFDTHLQKWGKMVGDYKVLVDYQANNSYLPSNAGYEKFGIYAGIVGEDGKLRLFDDKPTESRITYGKLGYYRQGMTTLEEIRVHHRVPVSGTIEVQTSVEGKVLEPGFIRSESFTGSVFWQLNGGYSGKWHNVNIKGHFDISYIEYRGIPQGRR